MKAILALIFIIAIFSAGYLAGRLGKKRAVAQLYNKVSDVTTQVHTLLNADPISQPGVFSVQKQITRDSLARYEETARTL